MQDAGAGGFDWMHAVTGLIGAVVGGVSGLVAGVWRVARVEPTIRKDFDESLIAAERRVDTKVDEMTEHFQESFNGIRRQIDDHKLHTETNFVRKDDFREFREEYREDMRDLKGAIEALRSKPS